MMMLSPKQINGWRGRFVDVRSLDEFASERLPGAACVPMDRLLKAANEWDPADEVLLMCQSGARAKQAAQQLEAVGFRMVSLVEGGLEACKKAGLEVIAAKKQIPIHRQVFIAAGVVMLIGLGLGLVNPWFLAVDGFVASMLIVAGFSGFCPMAKILQRMPWNAAAACSNRTCSAGS